jgi:exopolysaccharide biosynthesis polyprenyl glycosylphosphotransferase
MESMTTTSADGNGTLAVSPPVTPNLYLRPATASHRANELRRLLRVADVFAGLLAGVTAALIAQVSLPQLGIVALALAVAWPCFTFACGLHVADDLRSWASGVGEAPKLVLAALLLSWPLFGLFMLLGAPQTALGALAGSIMVTAAAGMTHATARTYAHRSPRLRQRTLIIGSGVVARQLVERLFQHEELALDPIGYLDSEDDAPGDSDIPALGGLEVLPHLLEANRVDRVMIAFSRAGHAELLQCIRECRDHGVAVDVVPRLFEFLDGARTIDQIGGMPLLSIAAPTFSRGSAAAKRLLDVTLAALALVVTAPLMLAVAMAIKLDSRGPVLFVQRRYGRSGRYFSLYKFRSMSVGSTVEVRDDGAIVKGANDARITRIGRIIRRFSLDEAPQLINVLRGEMSLVGPRPLVEEEAAVLRDWQERRADLRPGLTGPWQVAGRSHLPFQEMIKFDYQYVAGWSLARDIEILIATIPVVLSGRGAY